MKHLLPLLFLFSCFAKAEPNNFIPLGGAYIDNINDLTVKLGMAYQYEHIFENVDINGEKKEQWSYSKLVFSDIEAGKDSYLFTIGTGAFMYAGNLRLGLSHGRSNGKKLNGLTGTLSALFLSFKAGLYKVESGNSKFMMGMGFGF